MNEQAIAIPGCWDKDLAAYDDDHPCWRFCGGVMVVPRQYIGPLCAAVKAEYLNTLEQTRNVTWEVNVLARVEQSTHLPIWWYRADHNEQHVCKLSGNGVCRWPARLPIGFSP